jgi:hypothetical protein
MFELQFWICRYSKGGLKAAGPVDMAGARRFEDLLAWQRMRELNVEVQAVARLQRYLRSPGARRNARRRYRRPRNDPNTWNDPNAQNDPNVPNAPNDW